MTSPGTSPLTSTLVRRPSRRTTALWRTRECSAALARSARYSLTKPRPMLTSRMTPMMVACVLSPRKNDSTAVAASRPSTALFNWRIRTAAALTRCVRTEFGPTRANRACASVEDNPSAEVFRERITSARGATATYASLDTASPITVDTPDLPCRFQQESPFGRRDRPPRGTERIRVYRHRRDAHLDQVFSERWLGRRCLTTQR